MRLLAVDFGQKHIGLATCTLEGRIIEPLGEVRARRSLHATASLLGEIVRQVGADAIVLGVPVSEGDCRQANVCMQLARHLEQQGHEVHTVNEARTSQLARIRARSEYGKHAPGEHSLAAVEILERFLEGWEPPA
jgi:RNase H-fold protein (predicted Holliday junction resolvase)